MSEQSSRLVIILDSSGAQRNSESLADALNRLTAQGERATGATDNLGFSFKRLAASAAGALSIGAVIKIADDWGQVAARIKMALKSVEGDIKNYADIQERFLEISNRNGKNIEDVQLLYIGAATSMQELGYNTTQTIDYIESLSSAMTANASSANEVMSMQNALNKAMVAGKVAGENWNSIMNATPTLLGDIARQLEKQNGGIKVTEAQVKKMAAEGKISFKLFADAVMAAKDANNALADSMDNTVADGFNRVINSAKAYYGELNQSLGITRSMSAGLAVLSDNFSAVSTVITSVVGIGVARYFGNMATSMKNAAKETINQTRTAKENAKAQLDVATQEQRRAAAAVRNAQLDRARLQNDINRNARTRQSALLSAEYTAALSRERAAKLALVQANNAVAASQERLNTVTSIGARVTGMVRGGLALIGGPAGLAMLAAGGMYAWYESTKQAKEEARDFSREIPELISNLEKLNKEQAEGAKVKLTQNIRQLKEDAVDAKKEVESLAKDLALQKNMTLVARSEFAKNAGLEKERDLTEKLILKRAELDSITTKLSYSEESLGQVNSFLSLKTVEQMQAARQQQDALDALEPKVKLLSDAQAFLAQKLGITTNAMRQFNAQSLLLNYGGEDANKFIQGLKQQVELSEKTGKARAQLAAKQAAMRSGANPEGIKEAIRLAGIEYDNLEKQRELTKSKNATYSESAAQKRLSSLLEQNAALKLQSEIGDKLGAQQLALVKWNQEIAEIEKNKAKGKRLTDDQKSLLANKALISAELERAAEYEKIIQRKEAEVKIAAYNKQLMEETAQAQMQYEQTLEMTGKGSLEQGRLQEKFQLQNEFQKKQEELLKQYQDKSTGMTKEMYEKETQFLSEQLQKRLGILDNFHAKQNEQRENWKLGLQKGFAEFQERATDVYGNVAQISQSAFQGMSDSLSDFVLTGKANFADFTRSFLEMTTKMLMQMAMLNAMKAAFGGNAVGNFLGLKGHSEGGYTGDGGKYEPKGIVHGGEFVFTKEATQRLGIANLYRLMDYGQKGYASGGYVGGSAPMSVTQPTAFIARNPQVAGGGTNININMGDIKLDNGGQIQQSQSNQMNTNAVKREFQQMIEVGVNNLLRNPASALSRTIKGN
ncbi:TPA: phage tail tape measure protein [Providencia stuartii]